MFYNTFIAAWFNCLLYYYFSYFHSIEKREACLVETQKWNAQNRGYLCETDECCGFDFRHSSGFAD